MNLFVFAEQKEGRFRNSSFEAISAVSKLSREVTAVAVGSELNADAVAELGAYGAKKVVLIDDPMFAKYSGAGYAAAFVHHVKGKNPDGIFFSASSQGKDLAPRVAALLETGLASDCTELFLEGSKIRARRPIYAGKAYALLESVQPPFMATLRPNIFPAEKNSAPAQVEKVAAGIEASSCTAQVLETLKSEGGKTDVAEAHIVVSGGRGMQGPENWKLIEELAQAFGAATGASRAVVDAGWRPHSEQVGQTGKTVAPSLYIACGISGAIQHLAGMRTSKCIVAINKDPEAPIFKVADYGIVGDANEILPALTQAVKQVKAQQH